MASASHIRDFDSKRSSFASSARFSGTTNPTHVDLDVLGLFGSAAPAPTGSNPRLSTPPRPQFNDMIFGGGIESFSPMPTLASPSVPVTQSSSSFVSGRRATTQSPVISPLFKSSVVDYADSVVVHNSNPEPKKPSKPSTVSAFGLSPVQTLATGPAPASVAAASTTTAAAANNPSAYRLTSLTYQAPIHSQPVNVLNHQQSNAFQPAAFSPELDQTTSKSPQFVPSFLTSNVVGPSHPRRKTSEHGSPRLFAETIYHTQQRSRSPSTGPSSFGVDDTSETYDYATSPSSARSPNFVDDAPPALSLYSTTERFSSINKPPVREPFVADLHTSAALAPEVDQLPPRSTFPRPSMLPNRGSAGLFGRPSDTAAAGSAFTFTGGVGSGGSGSFSAKIYGFDPSQYEAVLDYIDRSCGYVVSHRVHTKRGLIVTFDSLESLNKVLGLDGSDIPELDIILGARRHEEDDRPIQPPSNPIDIPTGLANGRSHGAQGPHTSNTVSAQPRLLADEFAFPSDTTLPSVPQSVKPWEKAGFTKRKHYDEREDLSRTRKTQVKKVMSEPMSAHYDSKPSNEPGYTNDESGGIKPPGLLSRIADYAFSWL
ncbi:uncharacterized protein BJ171DRAFT_509905 [Polychytrium aggregatum]|uniref:uncharacterized protein n=1 Tax=Polychytrium aggregatum TaxID=110093 RepID=UPI0022FEB278|nr:uncharacterized protein BJ171DRAFT_509905 [Polychytrium aggregatum]KAI9203536.1 hypothetical protein BJ171DRAFT_509905 [Polychytrium aggregatum]